MRITKIKKINNFGIFKNFDWQSIFTTHTSTDKFTSSSDQIYDFKNINVFYGRNYSGKTTLSKIIRSLQTKHISSKYTNPDFEIIIDDGNSITQSNLHDFSHPIHVYNSDFVKENLKFIYNDDDKIQAFSVALGSDNQQILNTIDNLKKQLETDVNGKKAGVYFDEQNASEECAKLEFKLNKINAELNKLLTNKATKDKDSIKNRSDEFGNDVIRYDITKLRQDIETVANAHFKKLDAKGILDCQQLIKEDYKSKPQSIKSYNLDFLALSRNVAKLVLTKVGKSYKIDELIQDAQLNNWVDAGLKLHENRNVCAFCEGSISEDRIRKIRQHFDEESEALK